MASAMETMTGGFNNDMWNPIDFFLPGTSVLNKMFDPTGSAAAQQQAQSQLALNLQSQAFNAAEAQKQRDWEEKMAASEIQRRVSDLEAVGLNPYLALGSLGGANTSGGSSASSSSGQADLANNKLTAAAGLIAMVFRMLLSKH